MYQIHVISGQNEQSGSPPIFVQCGPGAMLDVLVSL